VPLRLTVTLCEADPPLPVHVSVKAVVAVSAAEVSVPAVDFVPVQPPLAEQLEAFVLLQVKVAVDPDATTVGFAERANVGIGGGGAGGAELPLPPPPQPPSTDETMIDAPIPDSRRPHMPRVSNLVVLSLLNYTRTNSRVGPHHPSWLVTPRTQTASTSWAALRPLRRAPAGRPGKPRSGTLPPSSNCLPEYPYSRDVSIS